MVWVGRFALHFDQQYDTIKIELDRGEEFFMTVKEAEDKGYRRAWRLRGNKAANYLSGEDNFLGGWGPSLSKICNLGSNQSCLYNCLYK